MGRLVPVPRTGINVFSLEPARISDTTIACRKWSTEEFPGWVKATTTRMKDRSTQHSLGAFGLDAPIDYNSIREPFILAFGTLSIAYCDECTNH
jgi:hypothetical protein